MVFSQILLHILVGLLLIGAGLFMVFFEPQLTPKILPFVFGILVMAVWGDSAPAFFGVENMQDIIAPIMLYCIIQIILDTERLFGSFIGAMFVLTGLLCIGLIEPHAAVLISNLMAKSASPIFFAIFGPVLGVLAIIAL